MMDLMMMMTMVLGNVHVLVILCLIIWLTGQGQEMTILNLRMIEDTFALVLVMTINGLGGGNVQMFLRDIAWILLLLRLNDLAQ